LLGFLLSTIPGIFLGAASIAVVLAAVIAILQRPDMIVALVLLTIPFGILWWAWSQIPQWFRTRLYKLLSRKRDRPRGGGD
jgi:polyferredoxin